MTTNTPSRADSFRAGIMFGLGFSIPFFALLWGIVGIVAYFDEQPKRAEGVGFARPEFGPESRIVVVEHGAQRGKASLYVHGQLENQGENSWRSVTLQVRLRSADDKLLGACDGSRFAPLRPGEKAFFQVDCDQWDQDAFPEYDHYEIEVIDASPVY